MAFACLPDTKTLDFIRLPSHSLFLRFLRFPSFHFIPVIFTAHFAFDSLTVDPDRPDSVASAARATAGALPPHETKVSGLAWLGFDAVEAIQPKREP